MLDPRYTPSGGLKNLVVSDLLGLGVTPYIDDAPRGPSMFFVVYETGDNTTVAEGEAVPLDLFYSRRITTAMSMTISMSSKIKTTMARTKFTRNGIGSRISRMISLAKPASLPTLSPFLP